MRPRENAKTTLIANLSAMMPPSGCSGTWSERCDPTCRIGGRPGGVHTTNEERDERETHRTDDESREHRDRIDRCTHERLLQEREGRQPHEVRGGLQQQARRDDVSDGRASPEQDPAEEERWKLDAEIHDRHDAED